MPNYKVTITVTDSNITRVKKAVALAFDKDISVAVAQIEKQPSRSDRLSEAEGWVSDAKGVVSDLKGELEEWKDNLPESLQNGSKADDLDEAVSALEEIESSLDNIDFITVSFPSMM